jgi:hypothetical protein
MRKSHPPHLSSFEPNKTIMLTEQQKVNIIDFLASGCYAPEVVESFTPEEHEFYIKMIDICG